MAQFKEYAVIGNITPRQSGTRVRTSPSTFTKLHAAFPNGVGQGVFVEIDLVREYIESVSSEYVKDGDRWGRVIKVNGVAVSAPAWMAIIYLGGSICIPNYIQPEAPAPGTKVNIKSMTVVTYYEDGSTTTELFEPKADAA